MICASIAVYAINNVEDDINEMNNRMEEYDSVGNYRSGAGWMIFVAIMGMIVETVIIVIRILNVSIINKNFIIFRIAVSHCFFVFLYQLKYVSWRQI